MNTLKRLNKLNPSLVILLVFYTPQLKLGSGFYLKGLKERFLILTTVHIPSLQVQTLYLQQQQLAPVYLQQNLVPFLG